ncbi:hypothetical protein PGIGA_G00121080 [Pangasianodon gigas]|uniref:Uncharacterized protein n=1 Tax=Pangasianodon gigas TaxID=30993 RepID=A0ACC5XGT0_PANGG|nr:hypothetical protein [Pangasianodon gigas]
MTFNIVAFCRTEPLCFYFLATLFRCDWSREGRMGRGQIRAVDHTIMERRRGAEDLTRSISLASSNIRLSRCSYTCCT